MALNTSQLFGLVEPVVRKFYGLEKNKKKRIFSEIFDVSKGKEAVRHSMELAGPGQLALKTENGPVTSLSIKQGSNKTWNYALYAGEVTLSWELARDNKVREIKTVAGSMGRAMALTPEYLAAQFLDRAFNSSYAATADGKELCATDHLIVGTSSSTGSNELATPAALSETSLEDIYTNLMSILGPDGMIVNVMPERLIVPAALGHTAKKLTRTGKTLGSANNDPKVVGDDLSLTVNPYLSSATRFFVKTDYSNGLFWEWDVESEFMEDNSPTTLQKIYVAFFRARWGCDDWRGIYGSAAS
jgi:hypothetical protein